MKQTDKNQLFKEKQVRTHWDEEQENELTIHCNDLKMFSQDGKMYVEKIFYFSFK